MPEATVIPIQFPDANAALKLAVEDRDLYAVTVGEFGLALKRGMLPTDAAAHLVAETLRATLHWPDEERRKLAEALEREIRRGR